MTTLRVLLILCLWSATAVHADVQERYVRSFPFLEPSILGRAQFQWVEVRLNDRRPVPFALIKTCEAPFEIDPLATQLDGDRIAPVNGVLRLRIRFRPMVAGEYRDTIELVRPPDDIVIIHLSGLGVSLTRRRVLDFGTLLTYDTSVTKVEAVRHVDVLSRWRMITFEGHKEDFSVATLSPLLSNNDTFGLAVRCSPTAVGRRECLVAFERLVEGGQGKSPVAVDTLSVVLVGNGVRQPEESDVNLDSVIVGTVRSAEQTIRLPVQLLSAFRYTLRPTSQQHPDVSVTLVEPTSDDASRQSSLRVGVRYLPMQPGDVNHHVLLVRELPGGRHVDSTLIRVRAVGIRRPEPPAREMIIAFEGSDRDTIWTRIGDTVVLPVLLRSLNGTRSYEARSCELDVYFDPGILVPISTQRVQRSSQVVEGTMAHVRFSAELSRPLVVGDTIVQAAFVAVAGNATGCDVGISSLTFTPSDGTRPNVVLADDSSFSQRRVPVALADVWWSNGRPRLVNTMQGTMGMTVEPNPVTDLVTITVSNVPREAATLVIVDALGRVVADLSSRFLASQGVVAFNVTSYAMQPGTYFVRCVVRSADGSSLQSIVRILVVT
jgi:hypothetical protein